METVSPIWDKRSGLTSLHNSQVAKECIDYQGNGALDMNANSSATPEPVVSPRCGVTAKTFSFRAFKLLSWFPSPFLGSIPQSREALFSSSFIVVPIAPGTSHEASSFNALAHPSPVLPP